MKLALFSLLLSALLLLGCADTPIAPVEPDSDSYSLIKLPPKAGLSVESTFFSVTNSIKCGEIILDEEYVAADGHIVKIYVNLKINEQSFSETTSETTNITITVDGENAAVWFSPHMVFNKPVTLQVAFEGIEIHELENLHGKYNFVFIDDDGNIEEVDYSKIIVKRRDGKIQVEEAYLNHFSRYAFTR
jgi:hypothetical protein